MRSFSIAALLFCCIFSNGQDISDTLSMVKKNTIKFYQHNTEIRFADISDIINSDPEASKYFRYAKINRSFSNVFLGLGIISFGYGVLNGLSYAIEEDEPSQLLAGTIAGIIVGGALIGISFPLKSTYKKHARKALKIYNHGLNVSGYRSPELIIGYTNNGFGFVIHF